MRSRDGSNAFSLSIWLLVLFSVVLNADEYLISYRYVVKDFVLYNEKLDISKAMKKCDGKIYDSITLDIKSESNLKNIISKNSDKFIEYIHRLGLHLKHRDLIINYRNSSSTVLTLKTTCFKVDINENFAIIAPLK